jgi:transcriptional regulator with XRE-family HTH domain
MSKRKLNNVKRIRNKLGLSLDEVAKRGGLSKSMVSKVEKGERIPTQIIIARICYGLGMPPEVVFNFDISIVE